MPGDRGSQTPRRECTEDSVSELSGLITAAAILSIARNPQETNNHVESKRSNQRSVQSDALSKLYTRDPAGQLSVYIYPGNHWEESYRLSTFVKWPKRVPLPINELAANGFYFTGYMDRLKCFSCGMSVEDWKIFDDPRDSQWHAPDCCMVNGTDERNVPTKLTKLKIILRNAFKARKDQHGSSSLPCAAQYKQTTSSSAPVYEIISGGAVGLCKKPSWNQSTATRHQIRFPPKGLGEVVSADHKKLLESLNLASESNRRKTFANWPSYPAPDLAGKLAFEGFFYLGNLDRVQCFSCSGVLKHWSKLDNPRTEHKKHYPNCSIVTGSDVFNIPMLEVERKRLDDEILQKMQSNVSYPVAPPNPPPEEQRLLAHHYPCNNPINPYMESLEARIATFSSWPAQKMKATPREIATAGLFYLGQNDRTKCYYCNGGLQNWDEYDEPWKEHAIWFPNCEFVLRMKGVPFVKNLYESHPNISRPVIRNPVQLIDYPTPVPAETTAASNNNENMIAQNALQQLIRDEMCKKCFQKNSDQLIQPCGHMALCSDCCKNTGYCPICHSKIASLIRVYRA